MSSLLDEEKDKGDSPWAEEIKSKKPKGVLVSSECSTSVLRSFFKELSPSDNKVYLLDGFPRQIQQARDFDEKVGTGKAIISLTCSPEIMAERRLKRARSDDDPAIAKSRERSHIEETLPAILDQEKQGRHVHEVASDKDGDEGWEVFKTALLRFTDTYLDHRDILSSNGIWVRRRQRDALDGRDVMEAKVRINGDYSRSTFDEITDRQGIYEVIRPHVPHLEPSASNLGLDILAHFTTVRWSFLANDKFTIVLDESDFGHSIGEVELMAEDEAEAHLQIDGFMRKYSSFFGRGKGDGEKPEGKLSAYLRRYGAGLRKEK
ncbi:MAG: hypothetical protein LQ352_008226 [Teloschistes flavicans]|nr:MAG: hypothetical protein LQ352_008226 [Teloschistes flavicans]